MQSLGRRVQPVVHHFDGYRTKRWAGVGNFFRGYNVGMKEVTVEQATGMLGDLVDAAIGGEDVLLVHNGHGTVRLVPVPPSEGRPQFGSAKGMITMSDDFDAPLEDFREYME
jgi:antitoxin (DNA-binding transcriptional repressor) of toxin-antitoxin stability system